MKKIFLSFILLSSIILIFACNSSEKVIIQYTVTSGGIIKGEQCQTLKVGEKGSLIIAEPSNNYIFCGWSDGVQEAQRADVASRSFITTAIFKEKTVLSYIADEGGVIDGESEQILGKGETAQMVSAIPYEGYQFSHWSDGKIENYRQDVAETDKQITAYFQKEQIRVIYVAGENGEIDGNLDQLIDPEDKTEIVIARPNEGYQFSHWSDGELNDARDDHIGGIYIAYFKPIEYEITYLVEGGKIAGDDSQMVAYGGQGSLVEVIPNPGYKFSYWSDGYLLSSRIDENVLKSKTVIAYCEPITYELTYSAGEGGSVIGLTKQTIKYQGNGEEVEAVAEQGYAFVKWSDGNTDSLRADLNITSDLSIEAQFRKVTFSGGKGTQTEPYLISKEQDLLDMVYFPDVYFLLTQNLQFQEELSLPIFPKENAFNGHFDGAGNTLLDLRITASGENVSLFGYIGSSGKIKNLNVSNFIITVTHYPSYRRYIGTICSELEGDLENINVEGEIYAYGFENQPVSLGGLVGKSRGTVKNCHANISIIVTGVQQKNNARTINIGGLIGDSSAEVLNSTTKGNIYVFSKEEIIWEYTGGLIGRYSENESLNETNIRECHSEIKIYSNHSAILGGLIGGVFTSRGRLNIINCSADGAIFIDQNELKDNILSKEVGGLIGSIINVSSVIENCFSTVNIFRNGGAGGFIGKVAAWDTSIINCYASCQMVGSGEKGGFCNEVNSAKILQCYSVISIRGATRAAGFIYTTIDNSIEECFSSVDIETENGFAGFIHSSNGEVRNSYAEGKIVVTNEDKSALIVGGGFIGICYKTVESCYSTVQIEMSIDYNKTEIGGFIQNLDVGGFVRNCHWLCARNGIAQETFYNSEGSTENIFKYELITEMYNLADQLNGGESNVWVNKEQSTPQLSFYY